MKRVETACEGLWRERMKAWDVEAASGDVGGVAGEVMGGWRGEEEELGLAGEEVRVWRGEHALGLRRPHTIITLYVPYVTSLLLIPRPLSLVTG